ncbi:MAG: argininosuccinate lyase [Candidatus Omnitrophica bacterium]|nr:argininosuccinate lyase [Candidatus Omnitrophota bacterium]
MTNKLWGGRFKKKIDPQFFQFQKSIDYDYLLAEYDIYHSLIHVIALNKSEILTDSECDRLLKALCEILKEVQTGGFKPNNSAEDIHSDIQQRVDKKIGKLSDKLHTLRSRNDQIAFDVKWFCFSSAVMVLEGLSSLIESFSVLSDKYPKSFMVGYTHLQRAQVVTFSNYLCAYSEMFKRDCLRLDNYVKSLTASIGSGALAGSAIDKKCYAQALKELLGKFSKDSLNVGPVLNSMDNVASRDFVVQFLSYLAIIQMNISRFSEDAILYSSKEFNFFDLPEEFCTGSSLMPHKKNPDFFELARGYSGPVYGNLVSILTTMKALPLTYNRDMQLDKQPLFSSFEIVRDEIAILSRLVPGITLKEDNINRALLDEMLYATELAEYLVSCGVAFKDAHEAIGKLIRYSQDKKIQIKDLSDEVLTKFHNKLVKKEIIKIFSPEWAVRSKKSLP